jgi:hypothetical protein
MSVKGERVRRGWIGAVRSVLFKIDGARIIGFRAVL